MLGLHPDAQFTPGCTVIKVEYGIDDDNFSVAVN